MKRQIIEAKDVREGLQRTKEHKKHLSEARMGRKAWNKGIDNRIKLKCQYCEREFKATPFRVKRSEVKYCSQKCYSLSRRINIEVFCRNCGKKFTAKPSRIKKNEAKYCSLKCFHISKEGIGRTEEIKRKIGLANTGKKRSDVVKNKMSKDRKGVKNPRWNGGKKAKYERRKNSLKYRLNARMRQGIWKSLKDGKNGRRWEDLVPYTAEEIQKRLDSTMPTGYNWQDFLDGNLHIDHIIPISVFNFDCPEHLDFQRCWALDNLQLLPAKENIHKSNKITKTFQPSLKI